jgi:predicted ArsR family transcriptional regulator
VDLGSQAAGIGVLADDTRRALYEYVVSQPDPVGREQAATAVGLPLHRASFHLDRLVAEGLLEVEFRRLTGRTGPGAGRPSKLYRRAAREFAVSLPARRYDLVGDILAAAVTRAAEGTSLERSLDECARDEGLDIGRAVTGPGDPDSVDALAEVLSTQGYEPYIEEGTVVLANCPFDSLARKHTDLVCGLNRSFVQGVADGLGCDATASLDPAPERCCVTARKPRSSPLR